MRPCIEKLNTDSDFDVRYYASEAAMGTDRFIQIIWVFILTFFQPTRAEKIQLK